MSSLLTIFKNKIQELADKELEGKLNGHFYKVIQTIFKGHDINKISIKMQFQTKNITDDDFDIIISNLRKSMIESKMFKIPLLKRAIMEVSNIRDLLVSDNSSHNSSKRPLFKRIGQTEGLKKVVSSVFELVCNDQVLSDFYKGKNVEVLENKYMHFIANIIGQEASYIGKAIEDVHLDVNTDRQMKKKCPITI